MAMKKVNGDVKVHAASSDCQYYSTICPSFSSSSSWKTYFMVVKSTTLAFYKHKHFRLAASFKFKLTNSTIIKRIIYEDAPDQLVLVNPSNQVLILTFDNDHFFRLLLACLGNYQIHKVDYTAKERRTEELKGQQDHPNQAPEPIDPKTLINNRYQIIQEIGKGSYSTVYSCRDIDCMDTESSRARVYALKMCDREFLKGIKRVHKVGRTMTVTDAYQDVQKEIALMKKLNHPNLLRLHAVFVENKPRMKEDDEPNNQIEEDENNVSQKLYMLLDYANQGQLMQWDPDTKRYKYTLAQPDEDSGENGLLMSESLAYYYFDQILDGLMYLHHQRICHRDLKPENLLLENKQLKIADFGVAHMFDEGKLNESPEDGDGMLKDSAGTYSFMPPESFSGERYDGYEADVWSIGVILYAMLIGKLPFQTWSKDIDDLFDIIETQDVEYPSSVNLSPKVKDLLNCILQKDPKQRITLQQIRRHPWMQQHRFEQMTEDERQELAKKEGREQKFERIDVSDEEIGHAFTTVKSIPDLVKLKKISQRWMKQAQSNLRRRKELIDKRPEESTTNSTVSVA